MLTGFQASGSAGRELLECSAGEAEVLDLSSHYLGMATSSGFWITFLIWRDTRRDQRKRQFLLTTGSQTARNVSGAKF